MNKILSFVVSILFTGIVNPVFSQDEDIKLPPIKTKVYDLANRIKIDEAEHLTDKNLVVFKNVRIVGHDGKEYRVLYYDKFSIKAYHTKAIEKEVPGHTGTTIQFRKDRTKRDIYEKLSKEHRYRQVEIYECDKFNEMGLIRERFSKNGDTCYNPDWYNSEDLCITLAEKYSKDLMPIDRFDRDRSYNSYEKIEKLGTVVSAKNGDLKIVRSTLNSKLHNKFGGSTKYQAMIVKNLACKI